jgi:hypothetical protein
MKMTHYYNKNGRVKQIEMRTRPGEYRAPSLRDARREGFAPGVTDVMKIAAKPGLERWKVQEAIKASYRLDSANYLSMDAFIADAAEKSKQQTIEKAARGSEIHAAIEHHYMGDTYGDGEIVSNVADFLDTEYGVLQWSPEVEFLSELDGYAYGGTADLVAGTIIVDIKTKDAFQSKMVWDDHVIQLALYSHALGCTDAANLFVGYGDEIYGELRHHRHSTNDLDRGLKIGRAMLALWYASNGMA